MMLLKRYALFPFLIAGLVLLTAGSAWAQSSTLRGFVTSASDGQPLPGVNVVLRNTAGGVYGSAADNDGFYAISRVPPGAYELSATFIGFATYTESITLVAGQIDTKSIALEEAQAELGEVVVESERETAGAANITAGLQTVRPSDIELIPAPDISADLVNYLTALPGVVSQGDRGGQLFIRGGEPTQNLVLLDGMLVYQPFHVVGFFSAFPADIINTADVYAGGYGGRYGGRLSSVIDVRARTGNKRQVAGAVSIAPFVSSGRIEGPIIPGRLSLLVSARQSVIEQGAEKLVDEPLPFSFGDRFAKLHANLGASAQLSVSVIDTEDEGRLGLDPLQGTDIEGPKTTTEDVVNWRNRAYGARFIFLPAALPIFAEILSSASELNNDFGPLDDPNRSTTVKRFSFSTNVTHYMGSLDFNWGLFLSSNELESNLGGLFQNLDLKREFVTEVGLYIEPEYTFGNGLRIQTGLRLQSFPSKSRTFIEPRLRMVWNAGIHRFSAAGGIYHQEITGLNDRRDAGDIFTAWTASPFGEVPEAIHAIGGWRVQPTDWLTFSAEGFYKKLSNLFVSEWTAFPRFTTNIQKADGSAKGADIRLEITAGNAFYGVVSYGLSDVKYETQIEALQLLSGEDVIEYAPPHDRRHQVNVITSLSYKGFDLSLHWQFGSGLPFNESLGFDRYILLDSLVNVLGTAGDERVLYGRPFTGRLPTYHRFDASLDYTYNITRRTGLTIQAGLINAYDRTNLFYLDLFTLRRVDQLPLIPTVGIKLELK